MSTRMVFDEIDFFNGYFQKEPSPYEQMLQVMFWEPAQSNRRVWGVEVQTKAEALREAERRKRKKAMENCQHGRLPFPIHWGPDVRR